MDIAFLTAAAWSDLYEDDRLAADALRARGHLVRPVVWTETSREALDRFDVVVMRTPWDWFKRRDEFASFLAMLARCRTCVVNTPGTLRAFADKRYLRRLEAKGVAVLPTEELTLPELASLAQRLDARGWNEVVLKPAFTANAVGAIRFTSSEAEAVAGRVRSKPEDSLYLLQPFLPEIAQGELGFVLFGGVFSHAVRKLPKPGEWRVQHEYGGQSAPWQVTADEVREVETLLSLAAPDTVYARVDVVRWKGRLHVMELELVEPELFFRHHPQAPQRFAEAVVARAAASR